MEKPKPAQQRLLNCQANLSFLHFAEHPSKTEVELTGETGFYQFLVYQDVSGNVTAQLMRNANQIDPSLIEDLENGEKHRLRNLKVDINLSFCQNQLSTKKKKKKRKEKIEIVHGRVCILFARKMETISWSRWFLVCLTLRAVWCHKWKKTWRSFSRQCLKVGWVSKQVRFVSVKAERPNHPLRDHDASHLTM